MRRGLFVLASAMLIVAAGSAVAGADGGRSAPKTAVANHEVTAPGADLGQGASATPTDVASDTRVLGLKWAGDPDATFTVETRNAKGDWHSAENVAKPDGGADPGSPDARRAAATVHGGFVSDPVSVPNADRVRVRVESGTVHDVQVVAVSSATGTASSHGGSGGGAVPPALAASAVAVGAFALTGRRGFAAVLIVMIGASGTLFALDAVHPSDAGAAPGQPRIVSRADWGADESARLRACPAGPDFAIPRIAVIHHTDGANGYSQAESPAIVRGLYAYSINTRGYCDQLYNFFVDRFGTIYEGRYGGITNGVIGAHATGFNTGTIGIALMGDYTSVRPSSATVSSLVSLLAWKMTLHRMNPYQPVPRLGTFVNPIIGHRDAGAVSGDGTSCPGQAAYDLLPAIRAAVNPQVDYGSPIGNLESVVKFPGQLHVRGWAIDPETTAPITVHAYVNGAIVGAYTANVNRPDVGDLYWWLGANHGFDITIPTGMGSAQVCVYAINVATGFGNPILGCVTPLVTPVGHLEALDRRPGTARLAGWAADPDTVDPIALHVYVDGRFSGAFTANTNRPDVGTAFPGFGNMHGFDINVAVGAGNHQVCVYGINVGSAAPNAVIGCAAVNGTPKGNLDALVQGPGSARLTGWAVDQDSAGPIGVHVYVDGRWGGAFTANTNRPDIGTAFPGYGNAHGFDVSVPVAAGNHRVCAYAIDVAPFSSNPLLGCRTTSTFTNGALDTATRAGSSVTLGGWVVDSDTGGPVAVHVYVDGGWGGAFTANTNRPDIGLAFPGFGPNHGFNAAVTVGPGTHQVCAYAISVGPGPINPRLGCRSV